jgi:hypothetical protein
VGERLRKNNRFPKSVSFNYTNPEDLKILEHVKEMNFSGYVKELILADIRKKEAREKAKGGIKLNLG